MRPAKNRNTYSIVCGLPILDVVVSEKPSLSAIFFFFIPVHITGYKLSHLRIQTVWFRSEIIVSGPQGAGYEVCAFFRYIHMRKWLIHQRMLRFRNFYSILML